MNASNQLDLSNLTDCPDWDMPFFGDEVHVNADDIPAHAHYKIYHDGSHYVGRVMIPLKKKGVAHKKPKEAIDIAFDSLYDHAVQQGLKKRKMADYIIAQLSNLFEGAENLEEYVEHHIKRQRHNVYNRKKRFRRKAYLNNWNYFVTFTYDDNKHSEDSFRRKLRKCLSNLHTRRNWRYQGVPEYAPETGRLHFHLLMYIPESEMIGTIEEVKSYSPKEGRMRSRMENSFFAENFGVNDFERIDDMAIKYGHTLDYLLKYMEKQSAKIIYSRGIPTEIVKELMDEQVITTFTDFVTKYLLFDNVFDWEKEIGKLKYRQMNIWDILVNTSQTA